MRWGPGSFAIPATTRCCWTRPWRTSAGTGLQTELQRRRAAGELVGAGIGIFVEKGGLGPLDGVRVGIDTTGAVELVTGGSSVGQDIASAMAQICADALGVDYRRVRVVLGQTNRIQYG